jgi:hypothetical protein
MLRDAHALSRLFVCLLLFAQVAAPQPPSSPTPTAQNATPPKPAVQPTPDPASTHFLSETGILLVAIKPAAVADYESVLTALQDALSKDTDATRSAAAKGWRVYKATETDAKSNALYVHVMSPAVTGFDYRPSLLLDELVKELAPELLSKYQEAFAMPPTKLNLTELANMSVAPVKKQEMKRN